MIYDIIIIGGGASGLLAAAVLAGKGRRVALLEAQARVGRKLLSTGNGRCNLTNRNARPSDYHGSRQAAQYALKCWPPKRIEALFEALGVPCAADGEGRVYPMSRQAASVLDALRLACDERGVDTLTEFEVVKLALQPLPPDDSRHGAADAHPASRREKGPQESVPSRDGRHSSEALSASRQGISSGERRHGAADALPASGQSGYAAAAKDGRRVSGRCCLICTGGLAAPKLGASGKGQELLKALGHSITPRFPAIAALVTPPEAVRGLKGIRAEGRLTLLAGGEAIREEAGEILFSESGVSGIAAMQLARGVNEALRANRACALRLDLCPQPVDLGRRAANLPKRAMEDFLNGIVPRRLGQTLVKSAGIPLNRPAGSLSHGELQRLHQILTGWTLPVTGTLGFDQAQVTAGGVSLKDFDLRALRSLRAPGLFAAGEILDVDGDCGGFNLQWAWSSALLAAEGIENYL